MYIAILGRQPELGIAELESLYGKDNVNWFGNIAATIDTTSQPNIELIGGTLKFGMVTKQYQNISWQDLKQQIISYYQEKFDQINKKITFGISLYGYDNLAVKDLFNLGLQLKKNFKKTNSTSFRLIPQDTVSLNTATSHHNKLGLSDNKIELLIVKNKDNFILAESTGAQNITLLANRDQARPKRDAFVGMLPPKLAQIMINLSSYNGHKLDLILDPFCGTGVVLQEAVLMGHDAAGSDLNPKMVNYSKINLEWFKERFSSYDLGKVKYLETADATKYNWPNANKISSVVSEVYLGNPLSAFPSDAKLLELKATCKNIIEDFLKNLSKQLDKSAMVVLAIPAWQDKNGNYSRISLNDKQLYGFRKIELKNVSSDNLIYSRSGQVVCRDLLILEHR